MVCSLSLSRAAASLSLSPWATSRRTSISRGVSRPSLAAGADGPMGLVIQLLEQDPGGGGVPRGPEPLERGSRSPERDRRGIATAERQECMGQLEPGAGRLERCAVPLEQIGALLQPGAGGLVVALCREQTALGIGDGGLKRLGTHRLPRCSRSSSRGTRA